MRGPIQGWRAHVAWAVIAVLFGIGFATYLFDGAGSLPAVTSEYHVRAVMPASGALAKQSRVTMAGVEVGNVENVERHGTGVVVDMTLDDAHAPIPADSRVALRQRTLIGEKYVEITPGRSPRILPDGGLLSMDRSDEFVEVDEVLSQLRGPTRQHARDAIRALGLAVGDRGPELNRVLDEASGMITTGTPVVQSLARERRHITRLVSNLGDLAAQIGDRGMVLRTLASQATATFEAIAGRDDALRSTLEELPATLDQVRRTAGTLRTTTRLATPVVSRLATAVDALGPTFGLLTPAARNGRRIVEELGAASPRLERTLVSLRRLSAPAVRALPKLQATLCELNPLVRYLVPYAKEFSSVITGLSSAVNSYDANGHLARLYIGAGTNSLIGGAPPEVSAAQSELLRMGVLQDVHLLGYNPYPEPGQVNENVVGRGSIGPADAENEYVRVQADC